MNNPKAYLVPQFIKNIFVQCYIGLLTVKNASEQQEEIKKMMFRRTIHLHTCHYLFCYFYREFHQRFDQMYIFGGALAAAQPHPDATASGPHAS